jgi:hypothetical protein
LRIRIVIDAEAAILPRSDTIIEENVVEFEVINLPATRLRFQQHGEAGVLPGFDGFDGIHHDSELAGRGHKTGIWRRGIRLVFGADYWGGSDFTELSPSKTSKYRGTIRLAGQI